MKSYEYLSHTADTRLKLQASTLQELFQAALEGMANIIKKDTCSKEKNLSEKIIISSPNTTTLLIDFLSEVLTLCHLNQAIYCKVEFQELKENHLKAKIFGCKLDSFDEDIKAVTYHEAEIKKDEKENYTTIVIFDI